MHRAFCKRASPRLPFLAPFKIIRKAYFSEFFFVLFFFGRDKKFLTWIFTLIWPVRHSYDTRIYNQGIISTPLNFILIKQSPLPNSFLIQIAQEEKINFDFAPNICTKSKQRRTGEVYGRVLGRVNELQKIPKYTVVCRKWVQDNLG